VVPIEEMAQNRDPYKESIEEYAQRENAEEAEKIRAKEEYLKNAERLAKETPARFFEFAKRLKDNVQRFNKTIDPERRLGWEESASLAANVSNLRADFNCTISRKKVEVYCALNELYRFGGAEAYIIEGHAKLREGKFHFRVEGFVRSTGIHYRITVDYKPLEISLEELADRLVLAAAKDDLLQIWR
jgi:hypothetical protein